jgi:poly(3-hydroxybutyrate) depolymerase
MLSPSRLAAQYLGQALWKEGTERTIMRRMAAQFEVFSRMRLTHSRPPTVSTPWRSMARKWLSMKRKPWSRLSVRCCISARTPRPCTRLCCWLHHSRAISRPCCAKTVRTLLRDHDVYLTDWHNARRRAAVAWWLQPRRLHAAADPFSLEAIGPGGHMVAVCQPCVAALAATALMAEDDNPATPRSLTLMAGPVDCRINPTGVNTLATSKPIEWFRRNLISHVPWPHAGVMRRVYPGSCSLRPS